MTEKEFLERMEEGAQLSESQLQEQLEQLDLSPLDDLIEGAVLPGLEDLSAAEILAKILEGELLFDWTTLAELGKNLLVGELRSSLYLCAEILAICILTGLLRNLSGTFGEGTASRMAALVCSCTVIALCLSGFQQAYGLASETIETLCSLMGALLPVMAPLLISMGNVTSGSLLDPLVSGAIALFASWAGRIILPLFFLSSVFFLGNSLMSRSYVKRLAGLLRSAGLFLTGLSVTVFTGFSALQNLAAQNADSLLLRTAKYVTSGSIPIVGGFAADSLDLVMQCARVIKNGLGIFGMAAAAGLLVMPLLKILVLSLLYKGTAALAEPLGDPVVTECLGEMGTSIMLLGVVLLLCALMFFLFLAILVSAGSAM